MLSGGERGDWWRAYDARFRQQMPSLEKARFGHLDQALYTRRSFWQGLGAFRGPGRRSCLLMRAAGLRKGREGRLLFVLHGMMGGHVLRCHVDFSMHVPNVGVIIVRWPVFRQVRGRRRLLFPSEHLVTGSSSESDVVLRSCYGHYY